MKSSRALSQKYLRPLLLAVPVILLLGGLPSIASAQQPKKPATSSSSSSSLNPKSAPASKPAAPAAKPEAKPEKPEAKPEKPEKPEEKSAAKPGGPASTGSAHAEPNKGTSNASKPGSPNKPGTPGTDKNKSETAKAEPVHPSATAPSDPRAPSGLNLRSSSSSASAAGASHANPSSTGGAKPGAKPGAGNAPNPGNSPATTRLAGGGTKTVHADGSSVERGRNGKITAVTTPNGAIAKFDAHGKPSAIHDGKGTTISRGPRGERRIETARADHNRLVSTGKHAGYADKQFTRNGHQFLERTRFSNGAYSAQVYAPYYYSGIAFYGYIPDLYYDPAFYGWAYNPWPVPVPWVWGWWGAPWYAPYGYYFAPYSVYPAPAFWLADFALAESLRLAAEEAAASASLRNGAGFVYASARLGQANQNAGSAVLTSDIKGEIAEQVKQIIADEKDAARQGGAAAPPAVPPSLDSRFTLFIASSALGVDTGAAACSLTPGDIIRRKEYTPDGNGTVAVEVVSSKNGDCPMGTAARLKVDDLEEMHDSFRAKVDSGLKSLGENQGKGGIPAGPAANPKPVPEGHAEPDLTVADELQKQQEAADATEKDVQAASAEDGSAD